MSEFQNCFDEKGFWVYELLAKNWIKHIRVKILLLFVLPSILLFITPLAERIRAVEGYTVWRILSLLLAATWVYLGPLLIWKFYNSHVTLFNNINLHSDAHNGNVKRIFKKNVLLNKRLVLVFSTTWIPLVIAVLLIKPDLLERYSIYGYSDCWYYVFVIYVAFILHLTACGIAGVASSILLTLELSKSGALIKDIIDDHNYALKNFGDFSFTTTKCFFSGVVFIPILVDFIFGTSAVYNTGLFFAICFFGICILLSFYVPFYYIKKSAESSKDEIISEVEFQYIVQYRMQRENVNLDGNQQIISQINLLMTYNHLQYVKSIDTSPAQMNKVLIVIAGAILPFFIFLFENFEMFQQIVVSMPL